MRVGFRTFAVVVVCSAIATALLLGSLKHSNAQTKSRYLPEYTATGELILPKNFHEWVYVGSPLTPNALNGGNAGFPEYHNVYIEPGSYEIFKQTLNFPKGRSCSRNSSLRCPPRTPTARVPSRRERATSPESSMARM